MTAEPSAQDAEQKSTRAEWHSQINALLYRIQQQDRLALHQLFTLCHGRLLGLIARIVRDDAEADDLLQEVFLKIWQQAERYQHRGSGWAWLCVLTRNAALDRRRKLQTHPHLSTDEEPALLLLLQEQRDVINQLSLGHCLATLKPNSRESILLSYLYGYSQSELAGLMAVPLGTIKSWIRRGLEALKQCLQP